MGANFRFWRAVIAGEDLQTISQSDSGIMGRALYVQLQNLLRSTKSTSAGVRLMSLSLDSGHIVVVSSVLFCIVASYAIFFSVFFPSTGNFVCQIVTFSLAAVVQSINRFWTHGHKTTTTSTLSYLPYQWLSILSSQIGLDGNTIETPD